MAYSSWVDVANSALIKVGANTIIGFTDNTKEARLTSTRYGPIRDKILRMCPWKSASTRAILAPSTTAPLFNFTYSFPLPTDCVRVIEIFPLDTSFKVEGRAIVSSNSTMDVRYVSNALDVSVYDPMLAEAIAFGIAADIGYALTEDQGFVDDLKKDYRQALKDAKAIDGMERSVQNLNATFLEQSRLAGTVFGLPFNPVLE